MGSMRSGRLLTPERLLVRCAVEFLKGARGVHVARALLAVMVGMASPVAVVGCGCNLTYVVRFDPTSMVLRVGESFAPSVKPIKSCEGVANTWLWTADDITVLRVELSTGRTTGVGQGRAFLLGTGSLYNDKIRIPVTVVLPQP